MADNHQSNEIQDNKNVAAENEITPTKHTGTRSSSYFVRVGIISGIFLVVSGGAFLLYSFLQKNEVPPDQKSQVTPTINKETKVLFETGPRLLFLIPSGFEGGYFNLVGNNLDFTYRTKASGADLIFINSDVPTKITGKNFDYTIDGKTAYEISENGKIYVVSGSAKYGPYENRTDNLGFLPDGRLIFSAQRDGKWHLVLNGVEGKAYDNLGDVDIVPSPSPKGDIAFKVRRIPKGSDPRASYYGNNHFFVVGGVEHTAYYDVSNGEYSEDGLKFAYVASRIDSETGEFDQAMVVNGVEGVWYTTVSRPFVMSADGNRIAYKAGTGKKDFFVVDNGVEGKHYNGIDDLISSPDGNHIAYTAVRENKSYLVKDGGEIASYSNEIKIDRTTFNNNGSSLMYRMKKQTGGESVLINTDGTHSLYTSTPIINKGEYVVVDGVQSDVYDSVRSRLSFSQNGKRYAYTAIKDGKIFPVIDGQVEQLYNKGNVESIDVQFSPDNRHYAYIVSSKDGNAGIVLNGKTMFSQDDDVYSIKFSPDSKYLGYVYKKGNEIWYDLLLVN